MAETIDSLEIAIKAQTTGVDKEIQALSDSFSNLSKSLTKSLITRLEKFAGLDLSGFDAKGMDKLTSALERLAGADTSNLTKLVNAITRMANTSSQMQAAATNLKPMKDAIAEIANIQPSGIEDTISAVARLSATAGNGTSAQGIRDITAAVMDFFTQLQAAPTIASDTQQLVVALGQIANAGKVTASSSTKVSQSFTKMGSSGNGLKKTFNTLVSLAKKLATVFGSLLVRSVQKLTSAFISLYTTGARAAANGIKSAGSLIVSKMKQIGSGSNDINKASSAFKGLLKAVLPFLSAYKIFQWASASTELASSLVEIQNVIDHAFGTAGAKKVEAFVDNSIEQYGIAELTAKQIAGRYQSMGVAMGITANQVKRASDNIKGAIVAEDYNKSADSLADMSIQMTKLAGDIASFYDADVENVAQALNSIYTGAARPLRQYGLDLTQATVQEWAHKQGIEAKMSSMTQAEKTMLRYQYVMANTSMIQGDAARTADTWANTMRRLKQNFQMLGATIGTILTNAFYPALKWLNNAIKNVNAFAETVGNALGAIFGWTIKTTPAGLADDAYADLTEEIDDAVGGTDDLSDGAASAAGNFDKATESAKELQRTILGFDEINKLNAPDNSSSNTSGTSGTPSSGGKKTGTAGTGGINTAEVNAGTAVVTKATNSLLEKYKSSIDTLEGLGSYISDKIRDALGRIEWDKVYAAAENFGTGLADFLNGLIKPETFAKIGESAANVINTALHFLDSFGDTFDWKNFGDSLAEGLKEFLLKLDWKLGAEVFDTLVNGIADAIIAALDDFPALEVGNEIGDAVKEALAGIQWEEKVFVAAALFGVKLAEFLNGLISPDTFSEIGGAVANALNTALWSLYGWAATFDWKNLGDSLAAGVKRFFEEWDPHLSAATFFTLTNGLFTALKEATDKHHVDFKDIGSKVGTFIFEALDGIKWKEEVFPAVANLGFALADFMNGLFSIETFAKIGETIADSINLVMVGVAAWATEFEWKEFGDDLAAGINSFFETWDPDWAADTFDLFTNGLFDALKEAADEINFEAIGFRISWFIYKTLHGLEWEEKIFPAVKSWGEGLAKFLKGLINEDTFKEVGKAVASKLKAALVFLNAFGNSENKEEGFDWTEFGNSLAAGAASAIKNLPVAELNEAIKTWADNIWKAINGFFATSAEEFDDTPLGDALSSIQTTLEELDGLIDFDSLATGFKSVADALSPMVEGFAKGFIEVLGTLSEIGAAVLLGIGFALKTIADALNSLPPEAVKALGEGLGMIAGALAGIAAAKAAASVIKSIAVGLGGATVAGGMTAVGGGMAAAGGAATATGGVLGWFASKLGLLTSPFGTALSALAAFKITLDKTSITIDEDVTPEFIELRDNTEKLGNKFDGTAESIGKAAEELGIADAIAKKAPPTYEQIQTAIDNMGASYGLTEQQIKALSDYLDDQKTVATPVRDAYDNIKSSLSLMTGGAKDAGDALDQNLKKAMGDSGDKAEGAEGKISSMKGKIWDMAKGMAAQALLLGVAGSTFGSIGTKSDETAPKIAAIATTMATTAKDVKTESENMGNNYADGFIDAIGAKEETMKTTMDKFGENSINAPFANAIGTHSPSTIAEGFGQDYIQGFIDGINDSALGQTLTTDVERIAGDIGQKFSDIAPNMTTHAQTALSNFQSGMSGNSWTVTGEASSLASSILGYFNIGTDMYNYGSSAVSNYVNGMKSVSVPSPHIYTAGYDIQYYNNGNNWFSIPYYDVSWYGRGGFPNTGELYMARESGPELVGRMGSRNAVANNQQITEGIKEAVIDGMMEVYMATGGMNGGDNGVPYVLNAVLKTENDEVLARAVARGQAKRSSRFNTVGIAY